MSGGFEVTVEDLRRAGQRAHAAAESSARITAADEMTRAAAGIPGAESAQTLTRVTAYWDQQFSTWHDRALYFQYRLDVAADTYQRGDDISGRSFLDLGVQDQRD